MFERLGPGCCFNVYCAFGHLKPILSYFAMKETKLIELQVSDLKQLAKKYSELDRLLIGIEGKFKRGLLGGIDVFRM